MYLVNQALEMQNEFQGLYNLVILLNQIRTSLQLQADQRIVCHKRYLNFRFFLNSTPGAQS